MGIKNKTKTINNIVMAPSYNGVSVVNGAKLHPMMEDLLETNANSVFNGKAEIGFSQVDAFAFNPRTKELILSNRFDSSHYESIEEFGDSDNLDDYILGYINFPGTSDGIPNGWMSEMMKEKTISLRYEGSFTDKTSYDRVHKTLDLLEKNGAPTDYKIVIMFGEKASSDGGFFLPSGGTTTIRYDNLKNRRLVDY